MKNKKIVLLSMAAGILAMSLMAAPMPVCADAIWDRWQQADSLAAAGQTAEAAVQWKFLADYYAGTGDWQNAALFSGKLDAYYDKIGDYDQAIHYYERENAFWVKAGKDWGDVKLQRAEQIRTTIEVYRQDADQERLRAASLPASGQLAKFEPAYGAYIGMYSEQDPKVGNYFTNIDDVYGKKHAIYLAYAHFGQPFPTIYAQRAKEAGGALQIAWEPDDGLSSVTDGAYLREWARAAKASGIPIFLRFASEMNGNWINWHGNPAAYISKFRMLHDVFAEEAPNVAMVWSPSDNYENGDPSVPPMLATSNVERLTRIYNTYADRKPIMLSETGVPHYSHATDEDFTEWAKLNLQRLYEIMPYKYPRLKAITYFNVDQGQGKARNDYLLSDNHEIQNYYSQLIRNPYLLSSVSEAAQPADGIGYVPLDADHQTFTKTMKLIPFIKIPDVYIGKVEYELNGRVLAAQSDLPYGLELQAGAVPEGSVLKIRVFNKAGKQVASKSFGVSSQIAVDVDGARPSFTQAPLSISGSTMVPLRAIFEAMGAEVSYDATTKTVTAQNGCTVAVLSIDQTTAYVNGTQVQLEVPAQLVNGYTVAPARFVGEAFGGQVSWDGKMRTVTITKGKLRGASR
ncbi:stalk domain-containing protein [Paenibacillus aestuarii]|uniref:Stalk domain-containing protein n=2 Tax=Paenibacillus aestuarii TaxID=516965 RepID=A0ABW0KA86_9BACL